LIPPEIGIDEPTFHGEQIMIDAAMNIMEDRQEIVLGNKEKKTNI
jgi:hypothetical protein